MRSALAEPHLMLSGLDKKKKTSRLPPVWLCDSQYHDPPPLQLVKFI